MVFPRLIQIKEFICFHKADARNALPVRVTVLLTPVLLRPIQISFFQPIPADMQFTDNTGRQEIAMLVQDVKIINSTDRSRQTPATISDFTPSV